MPTKPRLVFVSPVFPDTSKSGLAMRAGAMLKGLETQSQITLVIIPVYDLQTTSLSADMQLLCQRVCLIKPSWFRRVIIRLAKIVQSMRGEKVHQVDWHWASIPSIQRAVQSVLVESYDVLHVFRLYMAPFILPNLSSQFRPRCHLDLDDLESQTWVRLAALYEANGARAHAQDAHQASRDYANLEQSLLPQFDRISVCSEGDKDRLAETIPRSHIVVVPNVVNVPTTMLSAKKAESYFVFLFLGNLNYYPNQDAMTFFMEQVLPCLQQQTAHQIRLDVAGSGAWEGFQKYRSSQNFRYVGFVEDVASAYQEADAVVVPLRAGGGTRIKVLEAFSYRRPVVSTTIGIEGLEVEDGEHVLIADTPEAFARQCLRLLEQPQLVSTLTENAYACLLERYSQKVLGERLNLLMTASSQS